MSYEGMRGMVDMQNEDNKMSTNVNMPQGQREQHERKAAENRVVDKKAFVKFAVLLAVSCMIGFGVGILSAISEGKQNLFFDAVYHIVDVIAPFASIVLTTIVLSVTAIWVAQARKLFMTWDGEDEELIDRVDRKLTYAMILTSVNMILMYLFFTLGVYVTDYEDIYQMSTIVRIAANFGGLIYTLFVCTLLQKQIVNLTKEINPEKQGSVYDTKFQKNWLESCDESEKQQVYQAGYKAWQFGGYTCIALWVVCFIGMMSWDFGIMPVLMVLIIWLMMTIRYHVECIRMSKH